MNEFELIAEMLSDLNRRVSYLESDNEGRGSDDVQFRELHSRLSVLIDGMNKFLRLRGLPR